MAVDIVFEDPLTTVSKLLEKLKSAWDDIVNDVNHVLSFLPGFLTEPITSVFEMCSSKVTEVFNEIAKLFSERGSEPALRTVGESWNEQVGHRASTQAGLLTKEALEVDNRWTGDAAERYAEAVTAQGRALTQIKTITDTLQTTLNEIASALSSFWTGVAVIFGPYVVLMALCIIGICTGVGTVASLTTAMTLTITFLAALPILKINFINTLKEKKAKIEQQSTMDGQFANGDWPSAVANEMSALLTFLWVAVHDRPGRGGQRPPRVR
ncbi:MAG: WXG100 family type VII secretion target, partial [Pseudonocardiaceae bacterium]